jgi:hypothetical protein
VSAEGSPRPHVSRPRDVGLPSDRGQYLIDAEIDRGIRWPEPRYLRRAGHLPVLDGHALGLVRCQPVAQRIGGHGFRDEITLQLIAFELGQDSLLAFGFDTFASPRIRASLPRRLPSLRIP